MTPILVRFPNQSVKPDDVEKQRVLTTLRVIYEGGSLHGKTADYPTRDLRAPGGWCPPGYFAFF